MHSASVIVLLDAVMQAFTKGLAANHQDFAKGLAANSMKDADNLPGKLDKLIDRAVDKLFDRALSNSALYHVDDSMLMKPSADLDDPHPPAERNPPADRDRGSDRDRGRDRSRDRSRDRGRDRSNDRGNDRGRDRSNDRERDRGSDRGRDRDRESDRGRDQRGWAPAPPPPPPLPKRPPEKPPGMDELAWCCLQAARSEKGSTVQEAEVFVENPDGEKITPVVFKRFDEIRGFPQKIISDLSMFPAPSQIQAYTWPLTIDKKDIIGIAATGSGKTLAFLLPAFADMLDRQIRPERDGPGCLVLAPTRELAQQTEAEAEKFGGALGLRVVAMYGGAPKGEQMARYRQGAHTIVACPGRLNDFLDTGSVQVGNCKKFVLDEADRMLDMGFEPQIRKILEKVPKNRHTMFFTATWPKEVQNLATDILYKPYKVMIGNRDELKGNYDITQQVQIVDGGSKETEAFNIIKRAGATQGQSQAKVLVFCQTKRGCDSFAYYLSRNRVPATAIHGDKEQHQRDEALNGLKRGDIKVLVATDVAARGLDIKGIGLVMNYDPASNTEDYVHRIGRTGRAGIKGFAITLLTSADAVKAKGIMEVMERTDQPIPDELRDLANSAPAPRGRNRFSRYRESGAPAPSDSWWNGS